ERGLVSPVMRMKKWRAQLINYPLIQGQRLRYGDCLGEISKKLLLAGGWSPVLKPYCVLIQLGELISRPNVKFMFCYENWHLRAPQFFYIRANLQKSLWFAIGCWLCMTEKLWMSKMRLLQPNPQ